MRINDIIVESVLDEAISISSLYDPIKEAIASGIAQSIGNLYNMKGGFPKLEEKFDTGEGTRAMQQELFKAVTGPFEQWNMQDHIVREIKAALTKQLGKNVVRRFSFADLGDSTYGDASNTNIRVNEKVVNNIAIASVAKVFDMVIDSYGEGELTAGLWYIIKEIGRNDRHYVSYLLDDNKRRIDNIASTIVHEVVHVLQHTQQNKKGFGNHEYRSYLDKTKGEFSKLHSKRKRDDETQKRYYKLYMASPQEMAAFAHEIAIKMVNDFDLRDARNLEDFNHSASAIDAQSIVDYVNEKVGQYFRMPENRQEYAVYKRYVKLVYQELMRYIEQRRAKFQQT